jgi:hypothetical protein
MRAALIIFLLALGISPAAAQLTILQSDSDCVKACKQKDQVCYYPPGFILIPPPVLQMERCSKEADTCIAACPGGSSAPPAPSSPPK